MLGVFDDIAGRIDACRRSWLAQFCPVIARPWNTSVMVFQAA
jgi:hypothetical protein